MSTEMHPGCRIPAPVPAGCRNPGLSPLTVVARYTCLGLLLLLCSLPGYPAAARSPASADAVPARHLDQLALRLNHAPAPLRAELAQITIEELATSYAREARRAREDIRHRRVPRDLWRWVTAVEQLAAQLAALAGTVTADSTVHMGLRRGQGVYMVVDGRPVVVNGPRMHDQEALEQRVIARFCTHNSCDQLLPAGTPMDIQPLAGTLSAPPQWRFSEDAGPVCATDDGLEFRFRNTENLRLKRQVCTRLVSELNTLASAIARRKDYGTRVDWEALEIHTPMGTDRQRVELNNNGDYLRARLPLLVSRPELFARLRPWLAAKVGRYPQRLVVKNADSLLPRFYLPEQ